METKKEFQGFTRRRFISRIMPACSLVCLGAGRNLWGHSRKIEQAAEKGKHKFDQEFPRKLTNRQLMDLMYGREFIPFLKLMSEEIGDEKLIPILEQYAAGKGKEVGALLAKQFKGNDFPTWKKIFRPENPNYQISLTMSVTEDSDTVHELKVTECLWAEVFLKAGAGHLGHAAVCFGDYAMPTAFNPRIRMVRDKTLMQRHEYCNHRYLFGE
jgi:hypothetical protein